MLPWQPQSPCTATQAAHPTCPPTPPAVCMAAAEGDDRLPRASTCFNTLFLPAYSSPEALERRLLQAISGEQSFDEGACPASVHVVLDFAGSAREGQEEGVWVVAVCRCAPAPLDVLQWWLQGVHAAAC